MEDKSKKKAEQILRKLEWEDRLFEIKTILREMFKTSNNISNLLIVRDNLSFCTKCQIFASRIKIQMETLWNKIIVNLKNLISILWLKD